MGKLKLKYFLQHLPTFRNYFSFLPFIALPTPLNQEPENPDEDYFAEVGDTAIVKCPIPPGRLLQQYTVIWRNATSGDALATVSRSFTFRSHRQGFSIDPVTFALRISRVQLSDSGSIYWCQLGVVDPVTGNEEFFRGIEEREQRLTVYSE